MMTPDPCGPRRRAKIVQPPSDLAPHSEVLPIAAELVMRLNHGNIRYGVYKNRQCLRSGLAGLNDLDLLVATADVVRFETVLQSLKAVRGQPHPFHDNIVEGRSGWFVPDFSRGDYLHLDVVAGLRIGHRFAKRYFALDYDDVLEWEAAMGPLPPIPMVSAHEEARIALLKSIYSLPLWMRRDWVRVDNTSAQLIRGAMVDSPQATVLRYRFGSQEVLCTVRDTAGKIEVERKAICQLMALLRSRNNHSGFTERADLAVHHLRRLRYLATRSLQAAAPFNSIRKMAVPSGIVIALIGPDGVGKSTQSARLANIFRKKMRCTTVHVDSGGGGWRLRRLAHRGYEKLQGHFGRETRGASVHRNGLVSSIRGAVTGFERYLALRRASRAMARGAIVISNRWPQNVQAGFLDGPRCPPPRDLRAASWLSRVEQALYRRMAEYKPTETIHLVLDFKTSNARKSGDIDQPLFERRVSLMREIRERDPDIKTVDAGAALEEVTMNLFRIAWMALWRAAAGCAHRMESTETVNETLTAARKRCANSGGIS